MPYAEFHRGSSPPLGYMIARRQREKPSGPAIYQHPPWAIDNRDQLGVVRDVRYPHNWFAYIKLLQESSTRLLTHDADVLRSVVGIFNVMSVFRAEKWVCGMPSTMLDLALLWQPTGPLRSRTGTHSGHSFPSWSWIGWIGPVTLSESPGPVTISIEITDWSFSTPEHAIGNPKALELVRGYFDYSLPRQAQSVQKGLLVITPLPDLKARWFGTPRGSHRKILSGPRPFGDTKIELTSSLTRWV